MFDVLIVGGGVMGVYVVFDVSLCGLCVVFVEKSDFVLGMLLKLLKMVYGGLCYIE